MLRRERWFDEGSALSRLALEKHDYKIPWASTEPHYPCPCCLNAYSRPAVRARVLTDEHVPPLSLRGRALVLTCKECNNASGTAFDAHAKREAELEDFIRGEPTKRSLRAEIFAGDSRIRGVARVGAEGGVTLEGIPRQNHPDEMARHYNAVERLTRDNDGNMTMGFTITEDISDFRARVSWVRSAYLAAFAGLGWSYILRSALRPIRDQLRNPAEERIQNLVMKIPPQSAHRNRILVALSPQDLECVAVVFSGRVIFLPAPFGERTCEDLSRALHARSTASSELQVNLDGKEVPWPTHPTYFLDQPDPSHGSAKQTTG